jgi:hypothetical protein
MRRSSREAFGVTACMGVHSKSSLLPSGGGETTARALEVLKARMGERNARSDQRNLSRADRALPVMPPSPLARAVLVIVAFSALVDTVNVFTVIHDAAEHQQKLPLWQAATWEYTSCIAILLSCGIVYLAVRTAPPARAAWPRFIAVHAAAGLLFSGLHVALMNGLRVAIYAAKGDHYPFGESGFVYEYRKDVIAYIVIGTIFLLFIRRYDTESTPVSASRAVDIHDGKRLLRVTTDEIAAVRAAGNYIDYVLLDGRLPMVRKPLSAAARELYPCGFVRTHRSWLVNVALVREFWPRGAGDYEVDLTGGFRVPLSRRYPQALTRLRAPVFDVRSGDR